MNLFKRIFKKKITDKYLFEQLGKKVYIRNGVGYGFISDNFLYDNGYLEIGFGRTDNKYCRGLDRISDSPIKIVIDKNYIIKKVDKDYLNYRFLRKFNEIISQFKVGDKFIVKDKNLKTVIDQLFNYIPAKTWIAFDCFEQEYMLKLLTQKEHKLHYDQLPNPKNCKI